MCVSGAKDLSIAIATWNAGDLLAECLHSIYNNAVGIEFEVIVVDNASTDGTVAMVESRFPDVRLIVNSENRFFGPASNQVIRMSRSRYILLLNADTVVLPHALPRLVSFLDTHPKVGIVGAQLLNTDGSLQITCNRFPTCAFGLCEVLAINQHWPHNPVRRRHFYDGWDRRTTRAVDAVSGACMMARGSTIAEVGLLDEGFRFYYEEDDWCFRFRKAGWTVCYYPEAQVIHHGGYAQAALPSGLSDTLYWDSFLKLYEKHYGRTIKTLFAALLRSRQKFARSGRRDGVRMAT